MSQTKRIDNSIKLRMPFKVICFGLKSEFEIFLTFYFKMSGITAATPLRLKVVWCFSNPCTILGF